MWPAAAIAASSAFGAVDEPRAQRVAPGLGARRRQDGIDGCEPPVELLDVDVLEPLEHDGAALVPVRSRHGHERFERRARQLLGGRPARRAAGALRPAHGPSRAPVSGAGSCSAPCATCVPLTSGDQDRHRLPQPPGGHPGLMDAVIVTGNRLRNVAFEGRGTACEQQVVTEDFRRFMVGWRSTWRKTANKAVNSGRFRQYITAV